MLRMLLITVFTLTATPAFAGPGDGVSKEELKLQKEQRNDARHFHKKLDRYARRFERAADRERENKVARLDGKLSELYREELARLRSLGIQTKDAGEEPIHPTEVALTSARERELASETPKLEELRDTVVGLRDAQERRNGGVHVRPHELHLLDELQEAVSDRYDRKDRRYDEAKAQS